MRHQCRVPQLGRPADQRKAMLRGLTTQLIREGRVTTTKARAKALRDEAERMITLAKEGSLASRRRAIGYMYDKQLVHALFSKAQDRYGDRQGGYTRITRTVRRRGDNAEMAIIELVLSPRSPRNRHPRLLLKASASNGLPSACSTRVRRFAAGSASARAPAFRVNWRRRSPRSIHTDRCRLSPPVAPMPVFMPPGRWCISTVVDRFRPNAGPQP